MPEQEPLSTEDVILLASFILAGSIVFGLATYIWVDYAGSMALLQKLSGWGLLAGQWALRISLLGVLSLLLGGGLAFVALKIYKFYRRKATAVERTLGS